MKNYLQKKIIVMSRYALIGLSLQMLLAGMLLANSGIAQTKKLSEVYLSVDFNEKSLVTVFRTIETKTGFNFTFTDVAVDKNQKLSLVAKKSSLSDLLMQISREVNLKFKRVNNNIHISKLEKMDDLPLEEIDFPSQTRTITGKVTSMEDGEGLPGVNVVEKGTTNGTVTDIQGNYSLEVSEGATLVFSSVGYTQEEVVVGNQSVIDLTMVEDVKQLDELVVVGYGSVKKSDLTGSVGKVNLENTSQTPFTSVDQLLQGRVAGVQVVQSSGSPGAGLSFIVRGGNSLASNAPLIVIDGYPIDASVGDINLGSDNAVGQQAGFNPLANLNPNEIESIEILKDASSTAIYGSRGANGVVLITTKKGRSGYDEVSFNYRVDVSSVMNTLDVLGTDEFIQYANEAALNDGQDSIYNSTQIAELSQTNNFWQDQIYRDAISHDFQLAFSGGDDRSNYSLMGNYLMQNGVVNKSDFTRGSVRLNYGRKVSDALRLDFNMTATKTQANLGLHSSRNGLVSGNTIISAIFFRPFERGYDDAGLADQDIGNNPVTLIDLVRDITENTLILTNLNAELKLTKDLTLKSNIGFNNNEGIRQNYFPRGTFRGDQAGGYAYRGESSRFNYLTENTLSYNKQFNNSNLSAVVGYTWQEWNQRAMGTSAAGFANDNLTFENFQSGNLPGVTTTNHRQWALSSFLGRVNYSLADKYLFTFTSRYDGSSRLAEGNKWSFFPSAALAWKVHNENFMQSLKVINSLKLRASYGLSGNQSVGVGATQVTFNTDGYVIGGAINKGVIQNNMANPTLGWETTRQFNLGLDINLFKNRIKFEANAYHKITEDLLIDLPIPSATGFSNFLANAGSIQNQGLEFDLNAIIMDKAVSWMVGGNISFNRNKMIDLGPLGNDAIIFGPNYLTAGSALNQPIHVAIYNQPVGSFYGFIMDGIYQNEEEVAAGSEAGSAKPGDWKFRDISGDSVLTAEDQTIIGDPNPDFIFGLNSEIKYKSFSLSLFINGSIGNDLANLNRFRLEALADPSHNISQEAWDNRWRGEGTSNRFARPRTGGGYFNQRFSEEFIEDGSFIRLRNVTFSYDLPLSNRWLKSAKLFATATNLFTITNYTGYDPEVNADYQVGLTPGVDNGTYPQVRTYSMGMNLQF